MLENPLPPDGPSGASSTAAPVGPPLRPKPATLAPWARSVARIARAGFTTALIPIIPADGVVAAESAIKQQDVGKIPGRRRDDGYYAGFDWGTLVTTEPLVNSWLRAGSSIGIRTNEYLAIDIDVLDPSVAQALEELAVRELGAAPLRVGRAPKRLLVYRNAEGIGKLRLTFRLPSGDTEHAIEALGAGQQFVAFGIHPKTGKPYEWQRPLLRPAALAAVTATQRDDFFTAAAAYLATAGATDVRVGTTAGADAKRVDQMGLRAPTLDALHECMSFIPNDGDRNWFVKIAHAIAGATGDDAKGEEILEEFSTRYTAGANLAGWGREIYRTLKPPHAVGYPWLAELARAHGYNDAAIDFQAAEAAPPATGQPAAPRYSDGWLADAVAERLQDRIVYHADRETWYRWEHHIWLPLRVAAFRRLVADELRLIGQSWPVVDKGIERELRNVNSDVTARRVTSMLTGHRNLTRRQADFDADEFLVNTPAGMIDVRTGATTPPNPASLCTRSTAVAANAEMPAPNWSKFLAEFTSGDTDVQRWLQKHAGYAMTGSVRAQQALVFTGSGRNGKGVFARAIQHALGAIANGGYSHSPPSMIFADSRASQHPTEVASLAGSRLCTVFEVNSAHNWNEERLKSLTGGDPVTARLIGENNFSFAPTFKFWFLANDLPGLQQSNAAMRGRLRIVPCRFEAEGREDPLLDDKLRAEAPAILAWMLEGARLWLAEGLDVPAAVKTATAEYFSSQDVVGNWISQRCDFTNADAFTTTEDLYADWRAWAPMEGERVWSKKRLSEKLKTRPEFAAMSCRTNSKRGYRGVAVQGIWTPMAQQSGAC